MSNGGFNGPSFQTAAFRRRGKPLAFKVQHFKVTDFETGDGEEVDVVLRIDPNLDVVRLGTMLGGLGSLNNEMSQEAKFELIDKETPKVRNALRDAIVPHDRDKYDEVKEALDVTFLGGVVRWITNELSGKDPSEPAPSSDGSPETSTSSTDGAQPAA